MPLERSIVDALLPEGRATRALRGLAARLLVVVDGTGAASLHELFRAPLLERSEPEQKRTIHATLARTMSQSNLDPVSRVREVCRHLRGAGQYDVLVRYVRDHARELVRQGAASELTRVLDAVPEPHRTVELETLRARALARSVDLHRAFTVLESLVERAGAGDPEVMLTYARVATLMGRVELAEQTLLPLLEQPLSHEHRLRAMIAYALLATHRGRGDEARARLTAFEQEVIDPLGRAVLAGYLAFTYWLDERDHEAASLVPQAQALVQEVLARADSFRAAVGLPYGLAAVLGRLGRIDEAERLLAAARAASAIDEDVLMRLELRLVEGDVLFQKGERLAALNELEAVSSDARGGYLLADLWARVFRARVLRSLGRRRAAERLDLETERVAGEAGVVAIERAVGRSRAHSMLAPEQGDTQLEPEPKLGEWIRRLALEALERAARGDAERLEAVERASSAFIAAPGYGLDRALLALARAALAETLGRHAEAKSQQRRAFAEAEAEKIDADLLVELAPAVGSLRVVSPTSRRIASRVDTTGWELVLDAREHTLKAGERTLSLKNRHVVRCILYALAREPEHHLNKERLAEAAWGVAYDPRVHDGALKVNLLRLRTLLRDTGLAVDYEMDGYRLRGTAQLLFVEPLTVPD
jgi:tetratricopeptide (TPR) repeat protein